MKKKKSKQSKDLHDRGYKRLFSNQTIFRQLIETFVDAPWVQDLDFSDCERLDKTFINEAYQRRESDVIYKIRLKDEIVYVYILVEFQSTVHPFMVVRFLHYISSFYMDYINNHKNIKKLPAVFPVLLYNGNRKWTAKEELAEIIQGPEFGEYGAKLKYFKIVENEQTLEQLQQIGNIVSTLFMAEQHYDLETLIDELGKLFDNEEDRRAVTLFVNWLVQLTRYGRISEDDLGQMVDEYENSEEVEHMLKGREEGREEGEKRGVILAKQETFIRILEHKFDEFSDVIPEMIRQVDEISELDNWIDRVLLSESLSDLWEKPSHEAEMEKVSTDLDQEQEIDDLETLFDTTAPLDNVSPMQNQELHFMTPKPLQKPLKMPLLKPLIKMEIQ